MPLFDPALLVPGRLVKNFPKGRPQLPIEDAAATFRDEHNVIFALTVHDKIFTYISCG